MSLDIVTGIIKLFSRDVYCILDPGSTLSYMTPYVAIHFIFDPECILDLFFVPTLMGNSIVARRV